MHLETTPEKTPKNVSTPTPSSHTTASTALHRLSFLGFLSLLGAIASAYQSYHYYVVRSGENAFRSFCNINANFNCDLVSASRLAEVILGIPLASVSAGWFLTLFFIAWLARNPFWRREALRGAFLLSGVGVLVSFFYFSMMAFVLKTFCLVCILIDLFHLGSFAIIWNLKPEGFKTHKLDFQKWKLMGGTFATSLILAIVGLKVLDPALGKTNSEYDDFFKNAVQNILNTQPISINTVAAAPYFGTSEAPITIVEFSDFQCPHCRRGALFMNTLINRFPNHIKVIPRHFPLDSSCNQNVQHRGHPAACEAAKTVICANEQGKFQALYEALFETQSALKPGAPMELAKKQGLDTGKLTQCMESTATANLLSKDIEEAIRLGVQSTPTFFLNGRKVEGALTLSAWVELIENFLKP